MNFCKRICISPHGPYRRPEGSVAGFNRFAHSAGPGIVRKCIERMSRLVGSRPRKSATRRTREKRKERRGKRAERREQRDERRQKREEGGSQQ